MLTFKLLTATTNDKTKFCSSFSEKNTIIKYCSQIDSASNDISLYFCVKLFLDLLDFIHCFTSDEGFYH